MICQMRPRMRCSVPSAMSCGPMLTTEHPIPLEEVITMLLFSVIWKALRGFGFPLETDGLLRTRSSIVSGTESLMSLQRMRPSMGGTLVRTLHHGRTRELERTSALVEQLHRVLGDRQEVVDVLVAGEHLQGPARRAVSQSVTPSFSLSVQERTPLMCAVNDARSSSSIVC